jgi:methylated-DNA-[protein]-cysteine S-methyltransferase
MPARGMRSAARRSRGTSIPADIGTSDGGVRAGVVETALGPFAIGWRGDAVVRVALPHLGPGRGADEAEAQLARLVARLEGPVAREAVPDPWRAALEAYGAGQLDAIDAIPVATRALPPAHADIAEALRRVPAGVTVRYGELAARAGRPKAARAVGQAMARNPTPLLVPCHRVVASAGLGGFSSHGGLDDKRALLAHEARHGRHAALPYDAIAATRHLLRVEPAFEAIVERCGPCTLVLERPRAPFPSLARAIVFQQLSGKAASTIYARVSEALGAARIDDPARVLAAPEDTLRAGGLSRAKLLALRDLAARAVAGELPSDAEIDALDDDALVERLTVVRGVGRWTVEMMAIFRLGRPDVLPVDDFGVREGFRLWTRRRAQPSAEALRRAAEPWRPYRSVASWYLWRWLDATRA